MTWERKEDVVRYGAIGLPTCLNSVERAPGTGLGMKKCPQLVLPCSLRGDGGDSGWQTVSSGAFLLGSGLSPMEDTISLPHVVEGGP